MPIAADVHRISLLGIPVASQARCWTALYGFGKELTWRLESVNVDPPWTHFDVTRRGEPFGVFKVSLMGRHNLLNALAVIAVADDLGIPADLIARALETFEGIKRRQEIRGVKDGVMVMDDFAHHPTEVRETLAATRSFYPNRRIVAVFEPRTNSSRRRVFQQEYVKVFDGASQVVIKEPDALLQISEEERFSAKLLASDLVKRGVDGHYFPNTEQILEYLVGSIRPGDVVAILSNGGFDNIHTRLLSLIE